LGLCGLHALDLGVSPHGTARPLQPMDDQSAKLSSAKVEGTYVIIVAFSASDGYAGGVAVDRRRVTSAYALGRGRRPWNP
jgi:hypothetical protein